MDVLNDDILDEVINIVDRNSDIPEQRIKIDDTMSIGAVLQQGTLDESKTDYMYTEKIVLNSTKSFQLTGVNLNGYTVHPALRYVTAYDADGNYLADYKMENISEASITVGRTITVDDAVDSIIISIYKADNLITPTKRSYYWVVRVQVVKIVKHIPRLKRKSYQVLIPYFRLMKFATVPTKAALRILRISVPFAPEGL